MTTAPVTDPSAVDTEPDRPRPTASSEPERPAIELDAPATSAPPGTALENDAAVFVENAVVRFADQVAVDGISLVVPPGTILGLIGPSGSGKTTTIRVLTGALKPTSGTFRVLGEEPGRFRRETRERIGYMPQSFTLYRDLTVRENVDLIGSLFGMFFFERRRRTREVLETVDLWSVRGRRAGKLSGGMQRRLELACALVHDPDLMFLDEPTAGIDPLLRTRVWDELHRLRDSGRTLLVTTQYLNEAEACDHVALITEGQLVALATPSELRRQAAGGDIIEIETASRFDGLELESLPFIRHVRQDGPRNLRLTVDDAGTATPDVVDAITTQGGEVAFAREIRASFDDVFATLVARHRARTAEAGEDEPDPDTWPGGPLAAPSESGSDRGESAA